jgi:hypothetical protein
MENDKLDKMTSDTTGIGNSPKNAITLILD